MDTLRGVYATLATRRQFSIGTIAIENALGAHTRSAINHYMSHSGTMQSFGNLNSLDQNAASPDALSMTFCKGFTWGDLDGATEQVRLALDSNKPYISQV